MSEETKKNTFKFEVRTWKDGKEEILVENKLNENADLENFRKSVLFMAMISNVKAQSQEGELRRQLNKRHRMLAKTMDVFWKALDQFD